jgi:uncharacterized protein YkwD
MRKKIYRIGILLCTNLFLFSCGTRLEKPLDDFEHFIDEAEIKVEELFRNLRDDVRDWTETLPESIRKYLPDSMKESEEPENQGDSSPLEQYANRKLETAFKNLPMNYEYTFDAAAEMEIFRLLNDYRKEMGLYEMAYREDLHQSARYKSLSMLQHDYFSHDNPNFNGKPFDDLLWNQLGLTYNSIAENLAFISNSSSLASLEAVELFVGWQNSEAHNRQMLSTLHNYVGIGVVRARKGGAYYKGYSVLLGTQHFGH